MDYNYHTHTYRCGHAIGREEEYIERAIACGVKHMGFSDHMPYICSDGYESAYRVPVRDAKEYVSTLSFLQEKYKDKIDIKIGFEMEYYPDNYSDMLKNAIGYGAQYLILGQHFLKEEHPDVIYTYAETDSEDRLKEYVSCLVAGIKSGSFTYVAHPDILNFTGDMVIYRDEMRKVCVAARTYDVPLEINFLGIRDKRRYPNEAFWEIAGEEKSPVTFGFDAHDPLSAFDGVSLATAENLVKKYALNYIGKPKLKNLAANGEGIK